MSLDLDTRQRAILQEMGITVWQPEPVYIAEYSVEVPEIAINKIAVKAVNTPATAINTPPRAVSERPPVNLPAKQVDKPPSSLTSPAVALQPMPAGLQEMDWPTLLQTAQTCQACQLCTGRKGIVFGSPASVQPADWLIVGDPPTESDEAAGAAFTGEAGVLLGNMLKAMGLNDEQVTQKVTLTPSVKCRTEGQSTGAQELAQCEAFLRRQVALASPKMILAMGRYAAQALLANSVSNPVPPLGQLRGVVHQYQGIPVVVTYSPANLLRNPADKAKAWADLCLAKASF
jgi:uracil-DNA glycosylase family 4